MDSMSYRNNKPASAARNQAEQPTSAVRPATEPVRQVSRPVPVPNKRRPLKIGIIVVTIILIAAACTAGWLLTRSNTTAAAIDGSKYQAVFFTNGQVYFGKLSVINNDYSKLTNIYYLQTKTTGKDQKNPQETTAKSASDVELIKLGSEIHGPEDSMVINKDQVLFFENLKKDGNVSHTISTYQSRKSGGN